MAMLVYRLGLSLALLAGCQQSQSSDQRNADQAAGRKSLQADRPSQESATSIATQTNQTKASVPAAAEVYSSFGGPCPSDADWMQPQQPLPEGNLGLWRFAVASLGKIIGNGQCTELINQWQVQAPSFLTVRGTTDGGDDYVWGDLVATVTRPGDSVAPVLPGDIVQLQGAKIKSNDAQGNTAVLNPVHHTAVVSAVSLTRNALCVVEQNSAQNRAAAYAYFPTSGLLAGTLRIYRVTK